MTGIREKALAALREGRVTIAAAALDPNEHGGDGSPVVVLAFVSSSRDNGVKHVIDYQAPRGFGWACTCVRSPSTARKDHQ